MKKIVEEKQKSGFFIVKIYTKIGRRNRAKMAENQRERDEKIEKKYRRKKTQINKF